MKQTRILFQGDSITDGNRYKEEASRWDQNHQIGHSYAFIAAGSLGARYPERHLQFFNRGVSGDTVQRLDARWEDAALLMHPAFVSILIGTNDTSHCINEKQDPDAFRAAFERDYRRILDRSLEEDPAVRFILMEPFRLILPERGDLPRQEEAAAVLARLQGAVRRIAGDYPAVFVPLQRVFDEACARREPSYWLWDGVHPTPAGHFLVAEEWLRCAEGFILGRGS